MTWNQRYNIDNHKNAAMFREWTKRIDARKEVIVCNDDDANEEESLSCDECCKPVLDGKACDNCGDVLCKECRCYDEDISFCYECFMERFISYEEEEWML